VLILISKVEWEAGHRFLADMGLNLFGVIDVAELPGSIVAAVGNAGINLTKFQRLVLLGHAGKRLWQAIAENGWIEPDPIDTFSVLVARQFIGEYLKSPAWELLYPTSLNISLMDLGEYLGWSNPTPLGLGIHPEYGLWWAYRVAFLLDYPLPITPPDSRGSPCRQCQAQPCLSACPVGATDTSGIDWLQCATYRVMPASTCADRCQARLACPVGPQYQYPIPQIKYHYLHSLPAIHSYLESLDLLK